MGQIIAAIILIVPPLIGIATAAVRNERQHAENQDVLQRVETSVDEVRGDVKEIVVWQRDHETRHNAERGGYNETTIVIREGDDE